MVAKFIMAFFHGMAKLANWVFWLPVRQNFELLWSKAEFSLAMLTKILEQFFLYQMQREWPLANGLVLAEA